MKLNIELIDDLIKDELNRSGCSSHTNEEKCSYCKLVKQLEKTILVTELDFNNAIIIHRSGHLPLLHIAAQILSIGIRYGERTMENKTVDELLEKMEKEG